MLSKVAFILSISFAMAHVNILHAEIYKWKDANGKWRYSDVQPIGAEGVKQMSYHSRARKPQKNIAHQKESDKNTVSKVGGEAQPDGLAAIDQENLAIKRQNCQSAKANLTTYRVGGRIRRANKKGEMVFLNDTEMVEYTKQAEADVAKFCS